MTAPRGEAGPRGDARASLGSPPFLRALGQGVLKLGRELLRLGAPFSAHFRSSSIDLA
jgi:hypothetical protein